MEVLMLVFSQPEAQKRATVRPMVAYNLCFYGLLGLLLPTFGLREPLQVWFQIPTRRTTSKMVPDGHGRSFGSWPWQKQKGEQLI